MWSPYIAAVGLYGLIMIILYCFKKKLLEDHLKRFSGSAHAAPLPCRQPAPTDINTGDFYPSFIISYFIFCIYAPDLYIYFLKPKM